MSCKQVTVVDPTNPTSKSKPCRLLLKANIDQQINSQWLVIGQSLCLKRIQNMLSLENYGDEY